MTRNSNKENSSKLTHFILGPSRYREFRSVTVIPGALRTGRKHKVSPGRHRNQATGIRPCEGFSMKENFSFFVTKPYSNEHRLSCASEHPQSYPNPPAYIRV